MVTLTENHENLSELPSSKRPVLIGNMFLFLGAIAGGVGAFWGYTVIHNWLSIIFPVPLFLACLVLGAFSGIGVTSVADDYNRSRWLALPAAILIGMMVTYGVYLILSFLAGPT